MPRRREPSSQPVLDHLQGARILLVEDSRLNQEVALHFLRQLGLEVEVASHGGEALECLERGSYDAVLMDCQMPIMDGFEATRRIRAQARFSQLPIIAMTANDFEGDRERTLEAGMNAYLGKPIEATLLYETLGRWIARRDGQPVSCHVDVAEALSLLDGDEELFRQVATSFLGDAPAYREQFRTAWARADAVGATLAAHTLKGLAANIGAEPLREQVRALEEALREQDAPAVAARFSAVEQELAQVLVTLKDFLEEGSRLP